MKTSSGVLATVVTVAAILLSSCEAPGLDYAGSYDAAVKQARQTGRPVAIIFSTTWCGWCRRLEAETLSNSKVKDLQSKFIFVEVDGDKEKGLVRKYGIEGYPSTVFIDKSEKQLGSIVGFVPADKFVQEALKAYEKVGPVVPEKELQQMTALWEKGSAAYERGEYRTAIEALSAVASSKVDAEPVGKARELLVDIARRGHELVAEARTLSNDGRYAEAIPQLKSLIEQFAGTSVSKDAQEVLIALLADPAVVAWQKNSDASALLEKAEAAIKAKQYGSAMEMLKTIVANFGDTEAAESARGILHDLESDEAITRLIREEKMVSQCRSWLSMARSFEMNGDYRRAAEYYDRVIKEYPDSSFAAEARSKKSEAEK